MRLSDHTLSISDFRRLGAFEIYHEAEIPAFIKSREVTAKEAQKQNVPDDLSFRLGDLFSSTTKFGRLLWVARSPGILPERLMRRFAHRVAEECLSRLGKEKILSDIRLTAGMAAHMAFLEGESNLRSLEPFCDAIRQAITDHLVYSGDRAADGCRSVYAALDPDAYEAGAEAAHFYLDLFPDLKSEKWLRSTLKKLINDAD